MQWAVKEQWHSVWLSACSTCQTITTERSPVWSDRGDIEGTVHDGKSLESAFGFICLFSLL